MSDHSRDYAVRFEGPLYNAPSPRAGELARDYVRRLAHSFETWVCAQRPVLVPHEPPKHSCVFFGEDRNYYGLEAIEQYLKWRREND